MKGAAWIALYAVGAFVLGGALAGPLHALLHAMGIAPVDFPGFTLRLVQLFALLGLWPLLRILGLRGIGAWGLGQKFDSRTFISGVQKGFLAGALMMAALLAVLVAFGARSVGEHPAAVDWLPRLAGFLAAAVVVALVEEFWFRGALHSAFHRIGGAPAAICVVAALYAAVHFIEAGPTFAPSETGIRSGFEVIGDALGGLARSGSAGPASALFAAGVLLGIVRYRQRGVAECIGIHAGWVLINKTGRTLTSPAPDSGWFWLASGYDGVVGWGACALFSLVALLCWRLLAPARTSR